MLSQPKERSRLSDRSEVFGASRRVNFGGRKAGLTKQSSGATGVLSSNDACGLSHSQPNSSGREEIRIETTAIRE